MPIHSAAGSGDQDSPVFSYYEKSGGLAVVRYRQKSAVSTSTTEDYKTYERVYVHPSGEFASTGYSFEVGAAVTYPVTPNPAIDMGYGTYGAPGLARRSQTGISGKIEPSFVTPHTSAHESYNRDVSDVIFEDAGFGRMFYSGADQARFPGEFLLWCTVDNVGFGTYVNQKAYPFPGWTPEPPSFTSTRPVNYCWQVQKSYNESADCHSVLLLHGQDRESYAVAEYSNVSTSVKSYSKSTEGPFGSTIIPTDHLTFLNYNLQPQTFAPTGVLLADDGAGAGRFNYAIGGHGPADIVGQVCAMGAAISGFDTDGGSGSEPATSNTNRSITTVVGGLAFTESISNDDVFTTYVGGDFFRFRACASTFHPDHPRIVRQVNINDTSLLTANLGGCRPTANITTFIGVI